jgi:hypothetical protein
MSYKMNRVLFGTWFVAALVVLTGGVFVSTCCDKHEVQSVPFAMDVERLVEEESLNDRITIVEASKEDFDEKRIGRSQLEGKSPEEFLEDIATHANEGNTIVYKSFRPGLTNRYGPLPDLPAKHYYWTEGLDDRALLVYTVVYTPPPTNLSEDSRVKYQGVSEGEVVYEYTDLTDERRALLIFLVPYASILLLTGILGAWMSSRLDSSQQA